MRLTHWHSANQDAGTFRQAQESGLERFYRFGFAGASASIAATRCASCRGCARNIPTCVEGSRPPARLGRALQPQFGLEPAIGAIAKRASSATRLDAALDDRQAQPEAAAIARA